MKNIFTVIESNGNGFDGYTVNRYFVDLASAFDAVRGFEDEMFHTGRIFAVKDNNGELVRDWDLEVTTGDDEDNTAAGGLEPDNSGIPGRVTIDEDDEEYTDLFLVEEFTGTEYDMCYFPEYHLFTGAGAAFAFMMGTDNGTSLYRAKVDKDGELVPCEKIAEGYQLEQLEGGDEYILDDVTENRYTTMDGYGGFQDDWGWIPHDWAERGTITLHIPGDEERYPHFHPDGSKFYLSRLSSLGEPQMGHFSIEDYEGRVLFTLTKK